MSDQFASYREGPSTAPEIPVTWGLLFAVLEHAIPYSQLNEEQLHIMVGLLRENLETAESVIMRYYA
jgi:hypothetical protein